MKQELETEVERERKGLDYKSILFGALQLGVGGALIYVPESYSAGFVGGFIIGSGLVDIACGEIMTIPRESLKLVKFGWFGKE